MNKIKAIMNIKEQHKIGNNQDITNNLPSNKNETNIKPITNKTKRSSQTKPLNKDEIIALPSAKTRLKSPILLQPKDENLIQLHALWNILGVTSSYKDLFDIVSSQIPSIYKSSFYSNEIAKMTQLKVLIQKLNRDISSREKIIELIKTYDNYISLEYNTNSKKINEKILNEVKAALRDLRIVSLNIVREYKKIRREIGYEAFCGKYDLGSIENYKEDYMMKMKEDTMFLSKSSLGNWFRFSSEEDVFLSALRREVPCEEGVGLIVTECQFAMINETLMSQLYLQNKEENGRDGNDYKEDELYVERNDVNIVKKEEICDEALSKALDENIDKDIKKVIESLVQKQVGTQINYKEKEKGDDSHGDKEKEKEKETDNELIKQREKEDKLKKKKEKQMEKEAQLQKEKELRLQKLKEAQLEKEKELLLEKEREKELLLEKEKEQRLQKEKEKELQMQKEKELKQAKEKALKSLEEHNSNSLPSSDNLTNYIYETFTGHINTIQSTYTSLYNQIDPELKTALNIKENIPHYITGTLPHIIQIKATDNTLQGIAILSYDSNNLNGNKLIISTIFSIDYLIFPKLFLAFIAYCQKNYSHDEINIDLYYGFKDEKFYLIKPIEDLIKSKAKFRWVNMENDGKIRKIKYKLVNAPNLLANNEESPSELLPPPRINAIQIRSCSLLSLQESQPKDETECNEEQVSQENNNNNDDDGVVNKPKVLLKENENCILKIPLISLLCEMLYNNEYSIDHPLVQYMNLEAMKEISIPIIYNLIKSSKQDINDIIKDNMKELVSLFPLSKHPDYREEFLCSSLLNINLSFNTISPTKFNDCLYNRLSFDKIDVFSLCNNTNQSNEEDLFYLLKTKTEHISIMIYENKPPGNGRLSHFFNSTTTTDLLTDSFNEIYQDFIPKPLLSKKHIYLPPFSIEQNHLHKSPTILSDLNIATDDGKTFSPEYLHQMDIISFSPPSDTNQPLLLFNTDESKDDIIIKSDFLIAIVHYDILKEFEMANIASFIIKTNQA